jgi:hypothetical protein
VSLLGTNLLDGNNNDNLDVQTYGAIAINNLTASHSDTGDGANLYLDSLAVTGNVTLTGTNVFEGNSSGGFALIVNSKGSITANNLNVIANTYGAFVDNTAGTANVTLTGSNLFKGQNGTALSVTSKGTISVSNLSVESNFANGVKLDNSTGTGNVVLTGYGIFTNNGGYGLDISSKGAVTATNLTADYNHLSFSSYAVEIDNSSALTPKAVTLNGTNTFIGNGKYGLGVSSKGAITVSNLTANDNKAAGAYLNNDHAGAVGGITLKGSSAFLENGAGIFNVGVELASIGKITLTHVTADFNYQNGLQVDNASSVTITCGSFMDNGNAAGQYGIWANTPLLTLIGIDASGNYSGSYYSTGSIVFGTRTCTLP